MPNGPYRPRRGHSTPAWRTAADACEHATGMGALTRARGCTCGGGVMFERGRAAPSIGVAVAILAHAVAHGVAFAGELLCSGGVESQVLFRSGDVHSSGEGDGFSVVS